MRRPRPSALGAVERKELFVRIARDLIYGLSLGSVLLLAALGLAITFGLMGVINMAHGEMLMLGAYCDLRGAEASSSSYLPGARRLVPGRRAAGRVRRVLAGRHAARAHA